MVSRMFMVFALAVSEIGNIIYCMKLKLCVGSIGI